MKPAAIAAFAFALALAAPSPAGAQGVGLRAGPGGGAAWGIAPSLSAHIGSPVVDWSPAEPFRLSAGMVQTNNGIGLSGAPEAGNQLAPYLGIGYGKVAGAGVSFRIDLGVVAQPQSDAAAERYSLGPSLDKYRYYPVGQIGISVGF
ncbi:MAG TPA: hypothetical protein VLX30_10120 [Burkholderiales bacterium]|nr:hypothetical protein [Burkholderiales bacterium]